MNTSPFAALLVLGSVCVASAATYRPDSTKPLGFPIYTNQPAGNTLENDPVRRAAKEPQLHPLESQRKMKVPPGFEVRLFASEPEVVNPVAMTWDDRGRLWVVELYEYPKGAKKGEKGRDRIKILEDTDADGTADKVTVFAEGYSLATGIALGNGGVYLGQAPDLLFLEDTNGDDKADKTTKLLTGFGLEDRHELLNGFAWGPDGWLYMTHGVFTHSKVRDPNAHDPDGFGVQMDAALARFNPKTKKFEVFADGTSNPWGVDWNERGDAFVSACVIQHLFHMAPGGQYNRQGGTWANPYGYVGDLPSKGLPAIVNFRHYRAAHSGICVYQGDQWPAEWRGLVFLGNIHQNSLNCDRLTPVGSTYKAEKESKLLGPSKGDHEVGAGNFLISDDPWFRPVANHTGPDGAMWIADWSDKYPCYQNAQADPEGVDREMGRIWRVVWVGDEKGKAVASRPHKNLNLNESNNTQLAEELSHSNVWHRRQAQRILKERSDTTGFSVQYAPTNVEGRRHSVWAMSTGNRNMGSMWSGEREPEIRSWSARIIGNDRNGDGDSVEAINVQDEDLKVLQKLSTDADSYVRASVAVALRQFLSGSLTVNTPPRFSAEQIDLLPQFSALLSRPGVEGDTYYPHIVWMAMEPRVAADPRPFFPLVGANENPVSAYCAHRVMRRICDLSNTAARESHLNAAMTWLGSLADKTQLASAALDGLIIAYKSRTAPPTANMEPIFAKLSTNPKLTDKTRQLATLMGDKSAARMLIATINDPRVSVDERVQAIQAARQTKDDTAKAELLRMIPAEKDQSLIVEALRALGSFGGDEIAYAITGAWKNFIPSTRRAAADVLVTRSKWSRALLAGIDQKSVSPLDISATARGALARSDDATVRDHANRVLGTYRASGDDKLKLIAAKKKVVLAGEPDLKAGLEVARKNCLVCHKFHGEGMEVGPDLTGVGRSTLDALLHNVIDPNEVIGNGFETTTIETTDGRSLSGRVVEETDTRIKLLASGGVETVVLRNEIAVENGKPALRKLESSLMPEGLEAMPDADFRNLIWFILNPPQDQRAWTPALRRELLGDEKAGPGIKNASAK